MKVLIGIAVLMLAFMQPVAADGNPNCDEFSTREEFVTYLEDNTAFYAYDTDSDGVACEGLWGVVKSEVPARTDVPAGCGSDDGCFYEVYTVDDEIRIVATLIDVEEPEKMFTYQDQRLLEAGYVNITGTASEENLDFTDVDDHRTYWNSISGRVVIIAIKDDRGILMEVRNVPDEETNAFIENAFKSDKLVEPDKYEYEGTK